MHKHSVEDYQHRFEVLQFWHTWVGINYVILSVTFVLLLAIVWRILDPSNRELDWPRWWVRWARFVVGSMIFGTSSFLFGCGVHHFHTAWVMIPQVETNLATAYNKFGNVDAYANSAWVGNDHYAIHILLQVSQSIGGTVLLLGGLALYIAVKMASPVDKSASDAMD